MKISHTEQKHWVGNGFYVSNLLPGYEKHMNHEGLPFLMLDYQSPKYFAPTYQKLGVGTHPHKGFETLTIVYSGGVEHRDSKGNGGIIQAGEAQWMTAGRGIAHSEFYDADFLREGGEAEFVQIWIKLPPKDELTEPRYQSITQADVVEGEKNGIHIRLFAGSYKDLISATKTFSPIIIADLIWRSSTSETLDLPKGYKSYLLIRKGSVEIKRQAISPGSLVEIEETDTPLTIHGESGAEILLLSGEPWNDTIYHYGPFVLHDQKELFKTLGNGV